MTSLKHYPYVANSDFHKPKHLYSWKTLVVRAEKNWPAVRDALRANVDIALTLFRSDACGVRAERPPHSGLDSPAWASLGIFAAPGGRRKYGEL